MLSLLMASTLIVIPAQEDEVVGKRPYEMDWAGRTQDEHPPLFDFEDLSGWRVETENAQATFKRSREQQLWGQYVGKLTYRATDKRPEIRLRPPEPIKIDKFFDAVTLWAYGNNWAWVQDPSTPQIGIAAIFQTPEGQEFRVPVAHVNWKEWHLCHRRLTPEQIELVAGGAAFAGFAITNGTNTDDRVIYMDGFAVFEEEFPPLTFEPRPERGIPMLPGQTVGTNTGPGKLPFPTRLETILPDNLTRDFVTSVKQVGDEFVFSYAGADGKLIYRLKPESGTLGDITAYWEGRGEPIRPCVDGGVYLVGERGAVPPEKAEALGTALDGDRVVSRWRMTAGAASAEVTYTYRLWNKSLVIDVVAPGGQVAEVRFGRVLGLQSPRLVTNPYYTYSSSRPAVAVSGPTDAPLFLTGHIDWCLSNASTPWADNAVTDGEVCFNGGTRYIAKTDGVRNDCYERFFITLSPRYEEMLPTIPNPVSPWKHITGTRVWRAHGAGNRENDIAFWTKVHRYGMTQVVVTDHETMWRDGGESFTFRTKAAPGKGGDQGAYDYARVMIDKLGFVYGPYNNYTDLAPVNEYWQIDRVSRTPDNQLQSAWARCYAPKPARAVEFCAMLAPKIQEKFHFNTAYCDVHTAVAPWHRVDYDPRVPGAGTFAAVFYAYGEIMLHQKAAWNGPVYSEGNNHFSYCGLTDGNYGQDQGYKPATSPWLVDFDLRRMHDLCCNFGMGNPSMFYGRESTTGRTRHDTDSYIDRFLAATVAFGHPGFLTFEGGFQNALRSYYMLQQLHSSYCLASADTIRYADASGKLWDTSAAVASGLYKRSQVVTRYSNGCVTVVNGNPEERMKVEVGGRKLDLPPNGYAGWTEDGSIEVISADPEGQRCDYAATPAYLYVDGRGRFVRLAKAAGNGIGICRILGKGHYEIIPYDGAECGFAIKARKAVALDEAGKELGPAEVREARGLTYVVPVEGAVSYIVEGEEVVAAQGLTCERDNVVAGERVVVRGKTDHAFQIPADAKIGERVWRQIEGAWIDFTVVPMTYSDVRLEDNTLVVTLRSNFANPRDITVSAAGKTQTVQGLPGKPAEVRLDLGEPTEETAELLEITLRSGEFRQTLERGMRVEMGYRPVASLPEKWQAGMCLRGEKESYSMGQTLAHVVIGRSTCGEVTKNGIKMHPPYVGGVGYAFAVYDPIDLPARPAAVFRASVGKADGSDLGDGILYKVAVVTEEGKESIVGQTLVQKHEWLPIEGDLSAFAGQTVRIKIISDVGEADNSSGDWACWTDMRIEARDATLERVLEAEGEAYRRESGPWPVTGLTRDDLRRAKGGVLHYEGIGLSGTGDEYGTFAVINGVLLGNMAPAGGIETQNVWSEQVSVPLTPEAIATLDFRNKFELRNPRRDCFKVRRFWIELDLADGRKCSSDISTAVFTQPPEWLYAEGIGVPFGENITVDIWFPK